MGFARALFVTGSVLVGVGLLVALSLIGYTLAYPPKNPFEQVLTQVQPQPRPIMPNQGVTIMTTQRVKESRKDNESRFGVSSASGPSKFAEPKPPMKTLPQISARQLLDKVVEAHGGKAALRTLAVSKTTMQAKVPGPGQGGLQFTTLVDLPNNRMVKTTSLAAKGKVEEIVKQIYVGGEARIVAKNSKLPTQDAMRDEVRKAFLLESVTTIVPLYGKGYSLTMLPEADVKGAPAYAMRVKQGNQFEVIMYFDKSTYLLVKLDTVLQLDAMQINQQLFYLDYENVNGAQMARRIEVMQQNNRAIEFTDIERQPLDSIDDAEFE